MSNPFRLDRVKKNFEQLKIDLPKVLANEAQEFFVKTFNQQGWEGKGWKEVKRRIEGTPEYKYPKKKGLKRRTSPILVRTGKLRRAVGNSIRVATFSMVRLSVSTPYAIYHNEGTDTLPKRRFMARTRKLTLKHKQTINSAIRNCFK